MQQLKSSANQSTCISALIKENLRKFWPISLVAFLIMFISTVFPALMMHEFEDKVDFISDATRYNNVAYVLLSFVLPIIASVVVFRYNSSVGHTTIMHSLPMTKKTLFIGSYISGMIISLAPMILSAITLLPFIDFSFGSFEITIAKYYAQATMLAWLALIVAMLVIHLFVFSISAIAGMIAGNTALHVILSCVLNFVVLIFYALAIGYLSTFIIGFEASDTSGMIALHMHPLVLAVSSGDIYSSNAFAGSFSALAAIIYIIVSIALAVCAALLYQKRKVERTGDSIVFHSAEHVITYLISLIGMAAIGILFYSIYSDSLPPFFVGSFFGAVITFIIVSMILQKTPKIFNLKTVKRFGIFIIVAIVFISSTVFDITGYTNRVPSPASIRSGEIDFSSLPFTVPYSRYYDATFTISGENKEDVAIMIDFHKEAISASKLEREKRRNNPDGPYITNYAEKDYGYDIQMQNKYTWRTNLTLDYNTGGLFNLHRNYYYDANEQTLEGLLALSDFKTTTSLSSAIDFDNVISIAYSETYNSRLGESLPQFTLPLSTKQKMELLECFDKDYANLTYSQMIRNYEDIMFEFEIEYKNPANQSDSYYRGDSYYQEINKSHMNYAITEDFPKTIDWLKKNGIYDQLLEYQKKLL